MMAIENRTSLRIVIYSKENKDLWNKFVDDSKNGTFILKREYMEYHSGRFTDYSLMIYDENKLVAIMPASINEEEVRSHGGLTYGGFIVNRKMTAQLMLLVFKNVVDYLKEQGIKKLVYKRVPYVFYNYPSDEDLYALFRYGAQLTARNISTSILLSDRIRFSERRRRNVKKALKSNLIFSQSNDYKAYFEMLEEVLESRHGAKPVHSLSEMEYLTSQFPENIKLYATFDVDKMLAGVIIYETPLVAHTQYIASSYEGRNCGALDFCFDKLVNEVYTDKVYFDFGTSNEERGQYLNEGLIEQKQEFGARGVAYDEYTLNLV